MKMSDVTFNALKENISKFDTEVTREMYSRGNFPRATSCHDLWMRYRWDLFWAADGFKICGGKNLNDEHIDTALRKIVPEIFPTAECSRILG